jgi:SAM-dependent methyltransferase
MSLAAALRNWVDLEKDSLERSLRSAAPYAKGTLIDVGCGDKPYEPIFAPYVDRHLGFEYEKTYSDSLNAKKSKADFVSSGETLPFANEEFDTVLCTQVLEHAENPWLLFSELARVLRRGGALILTVPFSFRQHAEPFDFYRFTNHALRSLCGANGLEVAELRPRGGFWSVVGQKVASHLAVNLARVGVFGYEKETTVRPRYWTLPFVLPAIVVAATAGRTLDRVAFNPADTLGYLLVARKSG